MQFLFILEKKKAISVNISIAISDYEISFSLVEVLVTGEMMEDGEIHDQLPDQGTLASVGLILYLHLRLLHYLKT